MSPLYSVAYLLPVPDQYSCVLLPRSRQPDIITLTATCFCVFSSTPCCWALAKWTDVPLWSLLKIYHHNRLMFAFSLTKYNVEQTSSLVVPNFVFNSFCRTSRHFPFPGHSREFWRGSRGRGRRKRPARDATGGAMANVLGLRRKQGLLLQHGKNVG